MKHIKKVIVILVLSVLLVCTHTPIASADVLPPFPWNNRPHPRPAPKPSFFEYCFEIINVNEYPDYLLVETNKLGTQSDSLDNRIIKQNECVAPLKRGNQVSIYAMKKSEVKPHNIIVRSDQGTKLKNFNPHKFKLISATKTINPPLFPAIGRFHPHDEYRIEKVVDVLKIIAIKPTSLNLNFQKVIYTFERFRQHESVTKLYQKQDERPLLSFNNEPRNFLNLLIPGFSMIGMMLVYRKSKHFRNDYFS
jgi:hypothetical protein